MTLEERRIAQRERMRLARTDACYRSKERERLSLNRKLRHDGALCSWCARKAKRTVERMVATDEGFIKRNLPYCGEC